MPRAFWKGAIAFGMVIIPVKMYVATESSTPGFHLLHRKDMTRAKQVLYCPTDDEYFTRQDAVRGYEYTKGQYVVLDDADLENVPVKTAHRIDISAFVPVEQIDPVYFYDAHYLEPEELAVKPYALLRDTLLKTRRVGIARVTFQRREHLTCLRPLNGILALHSLHYADEIRPFGELAPPAQDITPDELEMAGTLVSAMAKDFHPEQYRDTYSEALHQLIEAKIKGEQVVAPAAPKAEIPDLMSALRASIDAARKGREQEKVGAPQG